jgi:VIT1/CCC1 family predicted Fe2+/Mn2+ transporter
VRCFADASPPAPRAVSTASPPSRPRLTERPVPFPATSTNSESGKYVKSLVFGGLDGIITTFAVVAASVGGSLNTDVILLMGFANLIADGLSMGFGDYLSSQAEFEYTRAEHKREKWELDNYPEGEKQEMVELYVARGMTQADAESVIEVMSKYKNFFLDVMMVEELGLMPPDESDSPAKNGMVTFVAFVVFGFIPLMSYVLAGATGASDVANFVAACVLTACTMLALGAAKAKFTNQSMVKSALLMLLNGGMAAVAAYLVSWGIAEAMGGVSAT